MGRGVVDVSGTWVSRESVCERLRVFLRSRSKCHLSDLPETVNGAFWRNGYISGWLANGGIFFLE